MRGPITPKAIRDAAGQPSASRNRSVLIVYTSAIFVSALLLFSVQPLFTKMVLPRLGGSPAVWSVAMVFFQSLLLGGYAYAHYLMQIRNRLVPVAIHLALLVVAMATLPLAIAGGWGDPPSSGYAVWLLGPYLVGLVFLAREGISFAGLRRMQEEEEDIVEELLDEDVEHERVHVGSRT